MNAADADYSQAITLDPLFVEPYFNRGDARRKLGMSTAAIADYTRGLELDSSRAYYFASRGFAKWLIDDLEGAVSDLNQALQLDPKLAFAYENRGVALTRLGKTEAGQQDWNESLKLVPTNQAYLQLLKEKLLPIYQKYPAPQTSVEFVMRGSVLFADGLYQQAVADFRRAAELDEFNADAFYDLGLSFDKLNYFDAAVEAYKKCVEADDRYFNAYQQLGELYRFRLNQFEEAIKCQDKAIEVKPDLVSAWASRGAAKKSLEDFPGAITDFDKTLELDPTYFFGWWNRAETYYKMGSYDKALADVTKSAELDPNSASALQLRGNVKRAKKDYQGAIADFTDSEKLAPGAYPLMYRGFAYLEMGNAAAAQKDFDAALKLLPSLKPEMDQEIAKIKSSN